MPGLQKVTVSVKGTDRGVVRESVGISVGGAEGGDTAPLAQGDAHVCPIGLPEKTVFEELNEIIPARTRFKDGYYDIILARLTVREVAHEALHAIIGCTGPGLVDCHDTGGALAKVQNTTFYAATRIHYDLRTTPVTVKDDKVSELIGVTKTVQPNLDKLIPLALPDYSPCPGSSISDEPQACFPSRVRCWPAVPGHPACCDPKCPPIYGSACYEAEPYHPSCCSILLETKQECSPWYPVVSCCEGVCTDLHDRTIDVSNCLGAVPELGLRLPPDAGAQERPLALPPGGIDCGDQSVCHVILLCAIR